MIVKLQTYYTARLDEYLRCSFPRPEGVAEVGAAENSAVDRTGHKLRDEEEKTEKISGN